MGWIPNLSVSTAICYENALTMKPRNVLLTGLASGLVMLFVYAALSKWLAFSLFRIQLRLQPLPDWSKPWLLWALPATELLLAGMLLGTRLRRWGFLLSAALLTVFSGYILLGILHVYAQVPCCCGGILRGFTWRQHLVFNLVCLGLALLGWWLSPRRESSG